MPSKYKANLIRVEFIGGPIDGKWVTLADWQERFLLPSPAAKGILHGYERGESYEGNYVRTVFRHCEVYEVAR